MNFIYVQKLTGSQLNLLHMARTEKLTKKLAKNKID